jgi:hypothetical protein
MALARRLAHEQSIGVLFTEQHGRRLAHADRIIVLARGDAPRPAGGGARRRARA